MTREQQKDAKFLSENVFGDHDDYIFDSIFGTPREEIKPRTEPFSASITYVMEEERLPECFLVSIDPAHPEGATITLKIAEGVADSDYQVLLSGDEADYLRSLPSLTTPLYLDESVMVYDDETY